MKAAANSAADWLRTRSVGCPNHPRAGLSAALKFHNLRHTYASLCVAAGIPPLEIGRFMGHNKVTTTLGIYAHLFADDHSDAMAALGAIAVPKRRAGNVIRLRVGKSAAGPF